MQAVKAVDTLLEANPDTPSYMIGIRENKITRVPLMEAVELVGILVKASTEVWGTNTTTQTRDVAKAISEKDFAKAMSLRDPEFAEVLDGFYHTSQLAKEPHLPLHKVKCFHIPLGYSG